MFKRGLAWLGIVIILGLFLYASVNSFQLLSQPAEQVLPAVQPEAESSRIDMPEIIGLSLVAGVLIFLIRRDNSRDKRNSHEQSSD